MIPRKEFNNKDFNVINNKEIWNNSKNTNDKPNTNLKIIDDKNNKNQIKINMNNFPENNMIGNNNNQGLIQHQFSIAICL